MTDSERSLLHRIQKFLQNHFQTVEVLERTGPADEVVLQEARASNAHIILFQLQPSDAFAVNISPQANVLVTAAPRFLLSNPALKRRLWDQMQQFLGIHL
jgi:2-polyprenyl-6-methoxyphenol hydroxylase-like FAD-dependent oxidoreductase